MLALWLVRHGQTDFSRENRFCGSIDPPLSNVGLRMAEALGEAHGKTGWEAIYCSPSQRARQTVAPLAKRAGLEPTLDEGLRDLLRRLGRHEARGGKGEVPRRVRILGARHRESGDARRRDRIHGGVARSAGARAHSARAPHRPRARRFAQGDSAHSRVRAARHGREALPRSHRSTGVCALSLRDQASRYGDAHDARRRLALAARSPRGRGYLACTPFTFAAAG